MPPNAALVAEVELVDFAKVEELAGGGRRGKDLQPYLGEEFGNLDWQKRSCKFCGTGV